MKTAHFLNLLLAVAVLLLSIRLAHTPEPAAPSADAAPTGSAMQNILTRTSIRAYTDRAVSREQIDTLLRAAMSAPTARNQQPWQFVVVNRRDVLQSLAALFPSTRMTAQAQAAVVVCGDMGKALPGDGQAYWIQDCSAATENLLLAAHAMGLGAVWCGVYPIADRVAGVRRVLQLPDSIMPLNIIPIGWPAEQPQPKNKWRPERVHYNRF